MDTILIIVVVIAVVLYLTNKIEALKNLFQSRIADTSQFEFNFSETVLSCPIILSLAGVTKTEYNEEFDKWPPERKKKWERFIESKESSFGYTDLSLTLTYLSHDDVFIAEAFEKNERYTYVVVNRSPNNTYLFDKMLVYFPNKDKDLRNEHIRLEVKLREDNGYYLITAGLREFTESKGVTRKSEYTKLFDFPFAKNGSSALSDHEYEKFSFEAKRSSPWYDEDDFGKLVAHPWDTQIDYKHRSGATITRQS